MPNTYIFLRHAETVKDPEVHAKLWKLAPEGLDKIHDYIQSGVLSSVQHIFASEEHKAIATAQPIADTYSLPIESYAEFNEIKRGDRFLSDEEFLVQKRRQMTELEEEIDGGESGRHALERFHSGIEKLNHAYQDSTILIVTHGTVMSLYFAELTGNLDAAFERWERLPFCAMGIVQASKVEKDII